MAEQLCELKKKGGGGIATFEQIGFKTITVTTATTMTLDKSISNYKFLLFFTYSGSSDVVVNSYPSQGIIAFVDVDYFKSNNITSQIASGTSGTMTLYNIKLQYTDNTTITVTKAGNSVNRNLYVYGIK